jgi:hypothetical protein
VPGPVWFAVLGEGDQYCGSDGYDGQQGIRGVERMLRCASYYQGQVDGAEDRCPHGCADLQCCVEQAAHVRSVPGPRLNTAP